MGGAHEHPDAGGVDVGDLGEVNDELGRGVLDAPVEHGAKLVGVGDVDLPVDEDDALDGARLGAHVVGDGYGKTHGFSFSGRGYSPEPASVESFELASVPSVPSSAASSSAERRSSA